MNAVVFAPPHYGTNRAQAWRAVRVGAACGLLTSLLPITPSLLGEYWLFSLAVGGVSSLFAGALAFRFLSPSLSESPLRRVPVPGVADRVVLGLSLLIISPTLIELFEHWTFSIWRNAHGLFVPLAVIFLVRRALLRESAMTLERSRWGYPVLMLALVLAVSSGGTPTLTASFGVVIALPAVSLLVLGVPMTRHLLSVFALGLFMLPMPIESALHTQLQEWAAIFTQSGLHLIGVPCLRDGSTLTLSTIVVNIREACSGVATIGASAFIGLLLASLSRSRTRAFWITVVAVPAGFVANGLRALGLVLMVLYFGPELLETHLHKGTGVVAFFLALGLIASVGGWQPVLALIGRDRPSAVPARVPRQAPNA